MLDHLFVRQHVVTRLRRGPLGPYLDDLAHHLHQQGYAPSSIQSYVRTGDTFGRWLHEHGYAVSELDDDIVERYVSGLKRYRSGHLPKAAEGLNHLYQFLLRQGVINQQHSISLKSPAEQWLTEYDAHLDQVVGLALSTRKIYRPFAKRFITTCFELAAPDWSTLTASMITAFVTQEGAARPGPDRQQPAVVVRSFLRFLIFRGEIMPGLEAAAPLPPRWRHAALPPRLSPEEIDRVLATTQNGRGLSRRNRAVILLLARLGLRAQEIVSLRLDDIDWTEGRLHIRPGKTHQARSLPLPQEAGQALVAYLRDDRPKRDHRQVFLQCRPPFQPLTYSAVWAIVRQAFQLAGIAPGPRRGSHIFRHTLASQLVNQGATFKDVADILGHRSLQTTGIYAKLDLQALQAAALPWLGGAPCKGIS